MSDSDRLHRTLVQQLTRLSLDYRSSPSPDAWRELLSVLSTMYTEADDERFTLRQSIDLSARETRSLHEALSRQTLQDTLTGLVWQQQGSSVAMTNFIAPT